MVTIINHYADDENDDDRHRHYAEDEDVDGDHHHYAADDDFNDVDTLTFSTLLKHLWSDKLCRTAF